MDRYSTFIILTNNHTNNYVTPYHTNTQTILQHFRTTYTNMFYNHHTVSNNGAFEHTDYHSKDYDVDLYLRLLPIDEV